MRQRAKTAIREERLLFILEDEKTVSWGLSLLLLSVFPELKDVGSVNRKTGQGCHRCCPVLITNSQQKRKGHCRAWWVWRRTSLWYPSQHPTGTGWRRRCVRRAVPVYNQQFPVRGGIAHQSAYWFLLVYFIWRQAEGVEMEVHIGNKLDSGLDRFV